MPYPEALVRHLVQALLLGVLGVMCIDARIFSVQQVIEVTPVVQAEESPSEVVQERVHDDEQCVWHQRGLEKRMVGDFNTVDACIQYENSRQAIASIHLKKSALGVRVDILLGERAT